MSVQFCITVNSMEYFEDKMKMHTEIQALALATNNGETPGGIQIIIKSQISRQCYLHSFEGTQPSF